LAGDTLDIPGHTWVESVTAVQGAVKGSGGAGGTATSSNCWCSSACSE
jgi:hypothetical protein